MRKLNNFEPILNQILKNFQPKAAVLQNSEIILHTLPKFGKSGTFRVVKYRFTHRKAVLYSIKSGTFPKATRKPPDSQAVVKS